MGKQEIKKVWVDEREVSAMTGIKVQTLRNWRCQSKGLPYSKVAGRSIRYHLADVETYFKQSRIDPEANR
jgi:hypothetical protein